MSLTIYGPPQTRVTRTLWMAHELGLEFDSETGFDENQTPTAELLAANAMGQSPTIDDDGFTLAESMAINLYLARKHGQLAPASLEDEAQTWRWSFWAMTALEPGLLDVLKHKFGVMGYEQDDEAAKAAAVTLWGISNCPATTPGAGPSFTAATATSGSMARLAPGRMMMRFWPLLSTQMGATPLPPGTRRAHVVSMPRSAKFWSVSVP